jgi:DNA-binding LacI/PurR family transcriptional regulator
MQSLAKIKPVQQLNRFNTELRPRYKAIATVKDIARISDVSPATVSNVITGKAVVNKHTRTRVLKVMQDLNYRPNAVARGLTQKRMNTLGVVFVHSEKSVEMNTFFTRMLDGILTVATLYEQNTTLCTITDWTIRDGVMSRLCDGRCDGVLLLVPPTDSSLITGLQETNTPFVLVNSHHPNADISSVDVADEAGTSEAVSHLIRLGHRRIAFMLNSGDLRFHFGRERLAGYRHALETAGIEFDESLVIELGDVPAHVSTWGRDVPLAPTAAFCIFDQRALDLIEYLTSLGLRVPEDFSIVGFDDIPEAMMSTPTLTTVRQPIRQIGEQATHMLLARINGTQLPGIKQLLPTELIVRHSTGPVPVR